MAHELEKRALLGDDFKGGTPRRDALRLCRQLRATRSWITVGCYAWWRYSDYLHAAQGKLLELRKNR
jgi:hypothetical protein